MTVDKRRRKERRSQLTKEQLSDAAKTEGATTPRAPYWDGAMEPQYAFAPALQRNEIKTSSKIQVVL
jgi:hypothetical protein